MFKVSFVEPQIGQQQDRQQQERQPQEDQREAVNIRWHTINQSTKKLVRKKDSTTTSTEPPDKGGASPGSLINREKSIEPPTDYSIEPLDKGGASTSSLIDREKSIEPPMDYSTEPLEPLQHQKSIQTNIKQSGRRLRREVVSQPEGLVDSVEKPVQGRIVRSRRARDVQNI